MAKASLFRRRLLVAGLIGAMSTSGCTRTVTHRVARFEPAGEAAPTTQPVRAAAVWKVKVRGHGERDYHAIDGTERLLQRGDVVGFRRGDDGVVYALANKDQIPLALTGEHHRVVWYTKTETPTDFGQSMAEVGQLTGQVLVGAAAVGLLGAALILSASNDDDCDNTR